MKFSSIVIILSIVVFVVLFAGSLFAWVGPTYRYTPGAAYHGGFFYWGTPIYGPAGTPGRLGGGRGVGGGFRGGGTGIGK